MKKLKLFATILFIVSIICCCNPAQYNDYTEKVEIEETQSTETVESESVTVEENTESDVQEEIPTETEQETETQLPEPVTYTIEWSGYQFSEEDFALICTTVFCEAGGETYKEKHAVAIAILNQISSGQFGDTVRKVIYKRNNFEVIGWKDFEKRGWTQSVENAVLDAMQANPYPRNMFYFRTGHYHTFVGAKDYKKIGKIYFSTKGDAKY